MKPDTCGSQLPSKRILVVEDQPSVMQFVVIQLTSLGYETKTASTLKEALALLDQYHFDLLFTDIALPKGEGGLELAEWVQATQPSMSVLLTSGYPPQSVASRGTGPLPLLRKPYRRDQLKSALSQTLAHAA
jgi:two-component system NtrC family sensor kinase